MNSQPPIAPQNDQLQTNKRLTQYDDEIDLLELWRALMRGKWIIVGFTTLFSVASVFYALSLPNMYKSTAVLAPAESSGGGLASMGGNLGGLASLAGINLGGGGSNQTAEALEILQSWGFIEEFIQEQNIAPQVFAVKSWNQESNELIYNNGGYNPQTKAWTRDAPKGTQAEPSSWELFKVFRGYLSVSENQTTGFTNLSIEYYSPGVAKQWVERLVSKVNLQFQKKDAKEAERNIAFLRQQIEQTPLASMQTVFFDLIEEQTKTLMLAKGSTEYVFKTVSNARVAEQRSKPKRALICVVGAMLGMMLGCLVGLVYGIRKKTLEAVV